MIGKKTFERIYRTIVCRNLSLTDLQATEENIQEIITRKKEICEEIYKIRNSLNEDLDQLQETLIRSINKTVDDVTLQLSNVKNSLIEIENKTSDITLEFKKNKRACV